MSVNVQVGTLRDMSTLAYSIGTNVSGIKRTIETAKYGLPSNILSKRNLYNLFSTVSVDMNCAQKRLNEIGAFLSYAADSYENVEKGLDSKMVCPVPEKPVGLADIGKYAATAGATAFTLSNVLKDDWTVSGSWKGYSSSKKGSFLGAETKGTVAGELFGGSVKTKSEAKWKDKNAYLEKSIVAEGHVAQGTLTGSVGYLEGSLKGTVGAVSATGSLGLSLYKDGKLAPAIDAKLKAEAAVAKGEVNAKFGSDDFDVHGKAEGSLLGASAEASLSAGMITYKGVNGEVIREPGVKGKVGAEAYLAEGKASGGFKIFGIKIDIGVSGKVGGAGANANFQATKGNFTGGFGLGLGVGAGLQLSVDWSDFSLW